MTLKINTKARVTEDHHPAKAGMIGTVRMRVDMNGKDVYVIEFADPVGSSIKVCKNSAWLPARVLEPVEG